MTQLNVQHYYDSHTMMIMMMMMRRRIVIGVYQETRVKVRRIGEEAGGGAIREGIAPPWPRDHLLVSSSSIINHPFLLQHF